MIHSLFPTTVYNIQIADTMRLELLDACNSVLTDVGEDHLLNIEGWNSTLHSAPDESNVINNIPIVIETFKLIKESIQDSEILNVMKNSALAARKLLRRDC